MTDRSGPSSSNAATTTKHSKPFFISKKLFRNKHLKAKRLRWLQKRLIINATGLIYKQTNNYQQFKNKTDFPEVKNSRTEKQKQHFKSLPPSITIDLLSDDESDVEVARSTPVKVFPENPNIQQHHSRTSNKTKSKRSNHNSNNNRLLLNNVAVNEQQQSMLQNNVPQLVMFPSSLQLCDVPNITLIPVEPTSLQQLASLQKQQSQLVNNNNSNTNNNNNNNNNKNNNISNSSRRQRKSQKPKRHHPTPIIINTESIVLSDDDDDDSAGPLEPVACSTPNNVMPSSRLLPPPLHINTDHTVTGPANTNIFGPRVTPIPEEVTVSLVPRSSTAGSSCSSRAYPCVNGATTAFPMLPDETTVHTVIANRTYELPLAKLREGLAISGVAEFMDDSKQKSTMLLNSYRKNAKINTPPSLISPTTQQPVSLKLSSDLSISLISDDEDDPMQQHLNAEKLLRQQPHLSVRPVVTVSASSRIVEDGNHQREPPKRRKLG